MTEGLFPAQLQGKSRSARSAASTTPSDSTPEISAVEEPRKLRLRLRHRVWRHQEVILAEGDKGTGRFHLVIQDPLTSSRRRQLALRGGGGGDEGNVFHSKRL